MRTGEHDIQLADGRILRVLDTGPSNGHTVVAFHGTPGCRLVPGTLLDALQAADIRLLTHDRPGYGGSMPQPGRRVANVALDVAEVADALGVGRFAVLGLSGGGPHALACAALLPERVIATPAVASPAPYDAKGLDWFAGMGDASLQINKLAVASRERLEQALVRITESLTSLQPAQYIERRGHMFAPQDRAVLDTELAAFLLNQFREGLRAGIEGWAEDQLAFVEPWGFNLAAVQVPVTLWCGEQDRQVPAAHARWLVAAIPGAELRLFPDEGHLSLPYRHVREIVDWIATQI